MTNQLSRRAALAGLGLASAMGVVPVAAATFAAPGVDRSGWNRAFAAMEKARAAYEAANDAFDAAHDRWDHDHPSMDTIHWKEFSFRNRDEVARVIDVEKEWAFYLESEGKLWWASNPEVTKARVRAAYDSVLEFRRREAAHDAKHGYSVASDRLDEASDAYSASTSALLKMPAPDGEALLWKMEYLWLGDEESSWSEPIISTILADARRLLSHERA